MHSPESSFVDIVTSSNLNFGGSVESDVKRFMLDKYASDLRLMLRSKNSSDQSKQKYHNITYTLILAFSATKLILDMTLCSHLLMYKKYQYYNMMSLYCVFFILNIEYL